MDLAGARVSFEKIIQLPLHVSPNVEFSPLPTPPPGGYPANFVENLLRNSNMKFQPISSSHLGCTMNTPLGKRAFSADPGRSPACPTRPLSTSTRPASFQIQNDGCVIRVFCLMNNISVTLIRYVMKSEPFKSIPRKRPGMESIIRSIFFPSSSLTASSPRDLQKTAYKQEFMNRDRKSVV